MKHLLKKISLVGAGGGGGSQRPNPPPPAKLEPPKFGIYKPYSSYNQVEIVDLLCEGPIQGFVNPLGRDLETENILEGIYLDDTPISTSSAVSNIASEVFNEYTLNSSIAQLGNILDRDQSAVKDSGVLDSAGIFGRVGNKFDAYLKNNDNVLLISIIHFNLAAYYSKSWSFHSIGYAAPSIEKSNEWNKITSVSATKLNENPLPVFSRISNLWYYKNKNFTNLEVHVMSTAKYDGIAFKAKEAWNILKNNTSINIYERQIIEKKLNLLENAFRNTHSQYPVQGNDKDWWFYSTGGWIFFQVSNQLNRTGSLNIGLKSGITDLDKTVVLNGKLIDFGFVLPQSGLENNLILDCIIPEIDSNNRFNGNVYGFVAIKIPTIKRDSQISVNTYGTGIFDYADMVKTIITQDFINSLKKVTKLGFTKNISNTTTVKYNYNNILCEVKYGERDQKPLNYFSKIYYDTEYKNKLLGPFRTAGEVRRFNEVQNLLNPASVTNPSLVGGNPTVLITSTTTDAEGSQDASRLSKKGSYTEVQQTFNENAIPITHIIENPETESVIVTILINELTDTLSYQLDIDGYNTSTTSNEMENVGTKIPTVVTVLIQTGKDYNGTIKESKSYTYTIYGNIPSACSIDFGNPNNDTSKFSFISQPNQSINQPFKLPTLSDTDINSEVKRFVKVFKVSAETYSVLLRKEIYVEKITEIVNSKFSYPFSAIVGTKIDARNQSAIPMRSYDCRLKKIKIPSNYNVIENGYDVRYQKSKTTYEEAGRKRIYDGDWDGSFQIGWTDNPAWILYDILTSKRYGLGRYIDESQINVWDLYKIGRYCDAVSDNGFYFGVADGRGGLEPRFSCNVLFNSPTKVFDAINIIANLFRGSVFFSHGEINFSDDRPKLPMAIFNNSNVKDGIFNYITNKKEDIFNTVEVAYLDRFDNFKTKIELVEDPEDIRKRGIQKTVVNTIGVTSRSMARRIGQHIIWQTTKENQAIEFTAGLESLFCKPGDLIIIDDELKTRNVNCGRVLEIDEVNRSLRLDNIYDDQKFDGYITLYTPTGFLTKDELYDKAISNRNRYTSFTINSTASLISPLNGFYLFSEYDEFGMALYTGYSSSKYNIYCYYDNIDKGWVLSTGKAYQRNNIFDKLISKTRNLQDELDLSTLYQYSLGNQRRGTALDASTSIIYGPYSAGGIYDNEIITESPRQITQYQISGVTTNINDGSIVYLNANNFNLNLLSIIEPGSPYRIGMKSFSDEVYKIISVREENQNEYLVVATKYDSGKWSAIENDTVIENPQQIFYDNSNLNKRVSSLETPYNLYLDSINETSSSFDLTGSFDSIYVTSNSFKITVENKAVGFKYETTTRDKQFNIPNLNDLGRYDLTVQVISSSASSLNSYPARIEKFIGYQKTEASIYDRPYIENFTII